MPEHQNENKINEMKNDTFIIFVYNADGGTINGIKDSFHKIFSPSTYDCNLCGISFGLGGMKKEWKHYIEDLPIPVQFLHRDEFYNRYPDERKEYPSAWIKQDNKLELFVSSIEMNTPKNLDELIKLITDKLIQKKIIPST